MATGAGYVLFSSAGFATGEPSPAPLWNLYQSSDESTTKDAFTALAIAFPVAHHKQ